MHTKGFHSNKAPPTQYLYFKQHQKELLAELFFIVSKSFYSQPNLQVSALLLSIIFSIPTEISTAVPLMNLIQNLDNYENTFIIFFTLVCTNLIINTILIHLYSGVLDSGSLIRPVLCTASFNSKPVSREINVFNTTKV